MILRSTRAFVTGACVVLGALAMGCSGSSAVSHAEAGVVVEGEAGTR